MANPVGDAAMDLAVNNHGIDDPAKVVHGRPVDDCCVAGLGIHLHFADVTPGREGKVRGIVESALVEPRFKLFQRIVVGDVSGKRHVAETNTFIRTLDPELT